MELSSSPQLDGDGVDGSSMLQYQSRDMTGGREGRRFVNRIKIKGKRNFRETETICQISTQSGLKGRINFFEKSKWSCFGNSFSVADLVSFCTKCKHKALLTWRKEELWCFILNWTKCPSCVLSFNLATLSPFLALGGYCDPPVSPQAPKGIQTLFLLCPVPTAPACPLVTPNWRDLQCAMVISWSTYVTNKSNTAMKHQIMQSLGRSAAFSYWTTYICLYRYLREIKQIYPIM